MDNEDSLCQACLLMDEAKRMIDWRRTVVGSGESLSYAECFRFCTQLKAPDDANAHYFCQMCALELKGAYGFIRKAQESDRTLREKISNSALAAKEDGDERRDVDAGDSSGIDLVLVQKKNTSASNDSKLLLRLMEEPTSPAPANEMSTGTVCLIEASSSSKIQTEQKTKLLTNAKSMGAVATRSTVRVCRSRAAVRERKTPSEEERVVCEYCSKKFLKRKLKSHISRYHESEMLLCHVCPRTFKEPTSLRVHAMTHQENREPNFTCEQCGKKFFTHCGHNRHLSTHDPNRQPLFKCDQCEKSFFHKGSLKLHQRLHEGATVECHICQKRYVRTIDLEIHLRSHSGEQPYKCTQCNKAFHVVYLLNRHLREHEGYRYKCEFCEKEYLHESTLTQHRKEHTGMPLKCAVCDKAFVKNYKMRRHIGGVHKIKGTDEIDKLIVKVKTKPTYRGRIRART